MIEPCDRLTEPTAVLSDLSAFNDVISSLNVRGSLLLAEGYEPPWAIAIPDGAKLAEALGLPEDIRVIPFHMVRRGSFELHVDGGVSSLIRAGEVAICTGSKAHTMLDGKPHKTIPFGDLLSRNQVTTGETTVSGATELICGIFMLSNIRNNPLLGALPDVVHTDISGRHGGRTLQILAELVQNEIESARSGQGYMLDRALEMLCAEAIRVYMETSDTNQKNWFRGLKDQKIGSALNYIHANPGAPISVSLLADSAGMSESRFAARFRETLGEAPMTYVSRWRMNLASRMLTDTTLSTEEIAFKIGYDSLPAFARAFKKYFETPPAAWRKQSRN